MSNCANSAVAASYWFSIKEVGLAFGREESFQTARCGAGADIRLTERMIWQTTELTFDRPRAKATPLPFSSLPHLLTHSEQQQQQQQQRQGRNEMAVAVSQSSSSSSSSSSSKSFKIILGSSSMARRAILAEMGYDFSIVSADIDEKSIRKEKPEELVVALAQAKADAIIAMLRATDQLVDDPSPTLTPTPTLLITADTVVIYKGRVREKPTSKEEARKFIKGYSGSHAAVVGSVLVSNLTTGARKAGWERAEVYFHEIPDEIIDSLIEEGITLNVAGGLSLEHPLTSPFVEAVVGSTDTVMGLSKALTEKLIAEVV